MKFFSFETKVIEKQIDGKTKYFPVYVIDEIDRLISHRRDVVSFGSKADAIEFLEEE